MLSLIEDPQTNNFLGTQPLITHVPPTRSPSTIATEAPWLAALLAAANPPDPAPRTIKSKVFFNFPTKYDFLILVEIDGLDQKCNELGKISNVRCRSY